MEKTSETYNGKEVVKVEKYGRMNKCVEKSCKYCGEEFLATLKKVKEGKGKFCSISCNTANRNEGETGEENNNYKGGKDESVCIECGEEFRYYESNKKGKYCSSCQKERPWYDSSIAVKGVSKKDIIIRSKERSTCSNCGESRTDILSFHHTGEKRDEIHNMKGGGYTIEEVEDEIESCIVLCRNCHQDKHYKVSAEEEPHRKKRMVKEIKERENCVECGEDRPGSLQFHHVGEKNHAVSKMVRSGFGIEEIKKEISMCNIVCANCHALKHIS